MNNYRYYYPIRDKIFIPGNIQIKKTNTPKGCETSILWVYSLL